MPPHRSIVPARFSLLVAGWLLPVALFGQTPRFLTPGLEDPPRPERLPPVQSPQFLPPPIEAAPSPAPAAASAKTVPGAPVLPAATSSTSASRQFIVHGADLRTRSAFCLLADETADDLARLLRDQAQDRLPVVILLKPPAEASHIGPAVTTNISQLAHGGFHLQVNVNIRRGFQPQDFTKELIRILLAERILRSHQELNTSRRRVLPDWLMTGVHQALEFRKRARPSVLFAAVFRSGRVYAIDALLDADAAQLDAVTRGIYETSSCALILALLEQPEGPLRFSRFLSALATETSSDRDLLNQYFPTLGVSRNSLEKWWTLQMAMLATPTVLETMSVAETERRLDEALTLQYRPKTAAAPRTNAEPAATPSTPALPPAAAPAPEEKSAPFFQLPFFKPRHKEIIFPFPKRDREPAPEDKYAPKSLDEAPLESAAPAAPPPTLKLPAKTPNTRKISNQPPLPAPVVPQPAPLPAAPAPIPPPAEPSPRPSPSFETSSSPKHSPGLFNPLNWFRKDSDAPPTPAAPQAPEPSSPHAPSPPASMLPPPPALQPQPVTGRSSASDTAQVISAPLSAYAAIMKRDDRSEILQRCLNHLNALKMRGHPLYRPLVADYTDVIRLLLKGKDKGVSARLISLERTRRQIHSQASEVESYVDWYQASQAEGYSHAFDDYLRLGERIEQETHPREDALSRYLDLINKEYE